MNYAYSPDTGEFINTATPAAWMEQTSVAPPEFDPATQGCFWRGAAWEVVTAAPDPEQVKLDILREIASLEYASMLPRVTREFMLGFMEASATPAQLAENIGYTKVKALDGQIKALRAKL